MKLSRAKRKALRAREVLIIKNKREALRRLSVSKIIESAPPGSAFTRFARPIFIPARQGFTVVAKVTV